MFSGGIVTVYVTDMERSVRFYTDSVDRNLWRALATGKGGEIASTPQ